jgi:hypothetical protein
MCSLRFHLLRNFFSFTLKRGKKSRRKEIDSKRQHRKKYLPNHRRHPPGCTTAIQYLT